MGSKEDGSDVMAAAVAAGAGRRVSLCLSGGGYRATLFHLGALRRLHELGLLGRLDAISSVSGGSIFAAVLADLAVEQGWSDGLALDDFELLARRVRAVTSDDLRTAPFLAHLPWNWVAPGPRVRQLERLLAARISRLRLDQLPARPRFVLCATDLTFGASWEFSRERVGSWRAGYVKGATAWPLARAVAASACFPPVFGPLPVGASERFTRGRQRAGRGAERPHVALSDGGVYDNLGLEPVWKDDGWLFVSDGGATFDFQASRSPVKRLLRYTSVATNQIRALRYRMLFDRLGGPALDGAAWSLRTQPEAGAPGYSEQLRRDRVERIRTDLDRFTAAEQKVLENHGYCVAAAKLSGEGVGGLGLGAPPPVVAPHPDWLDEARVRHALRRSHVRISPARMLGRG